MKLTWKIAKWEFTRNFTNKQFLIGLLLTPIIMLLFAGVPQLISKLDKPQQEVFYVIDEISEFGQLVEAATDTNLKFVPYQGEQAELDELVLEEEATGYFILNQAFLKTGQVQVHTAEKKVVFKELQGLLSNLLQGLRVQEIGIKQEQVAYLTSPALLSSVQIGGESNGDQSNRIGVSIALAGIVLFLIFTSGAMLLQSALQEKQDRMAEIILSSVSSDNLMQGKIIGHFLLGISQLVLWLSIGLPAAWYFLDIPIFEMISLGQLPILIFFALTGYLLFAALFVGIGSTMTDMQSASNTQGMVFMLPMLGFIFVGPVISNPNGLAAQIGTFFPLTSPTITILRLGLAEVPTWELVVAAITLLVTTLLVIKAAAKLFRVGMLMYGKSASAAEMWKWMRY
ncbi:ABC transporter permease [Desulfosporosinus hippei]|uniref:ABC-2 type transport system permease protein n=1 Tax=Desulfosporosinus hippei DSM 8344 TaxID=1121419 RepID=A0A1G8D0X5_9FIRM|nr:ABC transporter permease [Desulfosporosinus hippei]SDH51322.1 ABC-2 type transport system permease protein [Desulfosporosinus hippei DSM 8344]